MPDSHKIDLFPLLMWLEKERWEVYASSNGAEKRLEVNSAGKGFRVTVRGEEIYLGGSAADAVAAYNGERFEGRTQMPPDFERIRKGFRSLDAKDVLVRVKRLQHAEHLSLPFKETPGASGFDLRAARAGMLAVGERALVPTGFAYEIPPGFEMQIRPRSGLALKKGVTVLNAPGTIDSDYRGEVFVLLFNHGPNVWHFGSEERIAQAVFAAVPDVRLEQVDDLSQTDRASGGFGSTGK